MQQRIKTAILVECENAARKHSNEGYGDKLHNIRHGSERGANADNGLIFPIKSQVFLMLA